MKKVFLGLFLIVAGLSTGCLGSAADEIIGVWNYVPVYSTSVVHPMQWQFDANGQVIIIDQTNPTVLRDTGSYELYMNGTHRMLKISDTQIKDPYLRMNGEWYIVRMDFNIMVVGTKDYGGFQQRDLVR
jgi:hypothetical protein